MYERIKHQVPQHGKEQKQSSASVPVPKMTLTVEQMADELNISRPTAYSLVKEEGFPSLTIGHRVLVNRAGLQRWLDSKSGLQSPKST